MTEDDNGRIRAGDEVILYGMNVDDFFIKLLVFKERIEAKIEQIKSSRKHE
jgi:hypothetical protein